MSEIYGFYVPNKCVKHVVSAISTGLREFTNGFTCEARDLTRDSKSVLIQIHIQRDKDNVLGQVVSNLARTMSFHSRLPWFDGIIQHRDTGVVWDHTIPPRVRFKWQRRKYDYTLDKAHMVFSSMIAEIAEVYDKGVETNNRLDAVLRTSR